MSITITESVKIGNDNFSEVQTLSGSSETLVEETVADSETDLEIVVAIDFSALKGLYIVSDQDVTVETNDGASPDDTLSLKAGEPLVWHETSLHDCPLTADVTSIFVTNASGSAASITVVVSQDATPA